MKEVERFIEVVKVIPHLFRVVLVLQVLFNIEIGVSFEIDYLWKSLKVPLHVL